MKSKILLFAGALAAALSLESCSLLRDDSSDLSAGYAQIELSFDRSQYSDYESTKAVVGLVDTCDFLLKITDSKGASVYDGKYGDAGTSVIVKAGVYNVSVRSSSFPKAAFSEPLFGDDQTVVVADGQRVKVRLLCTQKNCGVKVSVSSAFLTQYPSSTLAVSGTGGKLQYSYSEKRYAYFSPGSVSLVMTTNAAEKTLLSKRLSEGEMLIVKVNCSTASTGTSGATSGGLEIQLDTTRIYYTAVVDLGGGTGGSGGSGGSSGGMGSTKETALNIADACNKVGAEDVWIYGYIVGGDLTSSNISFETPFSSATNIAISSRTSVNSKQDCMSVQLPTGTIRDRLNLRDNPGNLHKKVFLRGDIVAAYFGIPGIKNITEYSF